jgi:hypothetical protein
MEVFSASTIRRRQATISDDHIIRRRGANDADSLSHRAGYSAAAVAKLGLVKPRFFFSL